MARALPLRTVGKTGTRCVIFSVTHPGGVKEWRLKFAVHKRERLK